MSEPEEIAEEVDVDDEEKGQDDIFSFCQKYIDDWNKFYSTDYKKVVHDLALKGELRSSSFRSICWQLFLNIISSSSDPEYSSSTSSDHNEQESLLENKIPSNITEDPPSDCDTKTKPSVVEQWVQCISECRNEYESLKTSLLIDPTAAKQDNPLSQKSDSIWNQHFCDTELKTLIKKDVIRTFPMLEFFRNNNIQDLMISVLFCYARKYPYMCYRQGMHEILAPIIFVLHCDHQAMLHAMEHSEVDKHLMIILNENYLEHDAFTIFCKVMSSIDKYYLINDSTPTSSGYFPPSTNLSSITDNHVVDQLYSINEQLLKRNDKDVHDALYELKIPLTLFGIRWLRLLFGREFPLPDLLVLWDVIFAVGPHNSFELVGYVVVAMLIAIRDNILVSDHGECLSYLMRYPTDVDVNSIVEQALFLKYPEMSPEGSNPQCSSEEVNENPEKISSTETVTKTSKLKKKFRDRKYKFPSFPSRSSKSSSQNSGGDILEALPIVEESTITAHSQLLYYKDIMNKCHMKLTYCSQKIESNLSHPRVNSNSFHSVLCDIREVCSMLEVAQMSPARSLIEIASEANESRGQTPIQSPKLYLDSTVKVSNSKFYHSKVPIETSNEDVDNSMEEEDLPLTLPPPNTIVEMRTMSFKEIQQSDIP